MLLSLVWPVVKQHEAENIILGDVHVNSEKNIELS